MPNKEDADQCVCCGTKKPGSAPKVCVCVGGGCGGGWVGGREGEPLLFELPSSLQLKD